jgi:WD40 repeat protein
VYDLSIKYTFSVKVLMELLQVRFHPLHPEILASGSLDFEVRLWDANTSECIGSQDFCNFNSDSHLNAFCNSGCSLLLNKI